MQRVAFTHGVASGDPTTDGIVLWVRAVADDGRPVTVEHQVEDATTGEIVAFGQSTTDPGRDHTTQVIVDGLAAGTPHRYRFRSGDAVSVTGRFVTLPEDPDQISFAAVSCARYNVGYFTAYRHLAEQEGLSFVLHLGDYIYESGPLQMQVTPGDCQLPGRRSDPEHACCTLDDYRRRYRQYRSDPDLQAVHAAHAFIVGIDDHELADNAWCDGAPCHDEDESGPWEERVHAAMTAWEEWIPSRRRPAHGDDLNHSFDIGSLVRIASTESRTRRTNPELEGEDRAQLGNDQLAWLESLSTGCPTQWFVLASASVLAPLWDERFSGSALDALRWIKIANPDGPGPNMDRWNGYEHERTRVIDALEASPSAAVVLSGDVHVALSIDILSPSGLVAVDWTTSSITSQNLDDKCGWDRRTLTLECEREIRSMLSHLRFCNLDDHGYIVVELTRKAAACNWWFTDSVRTPDADVFCGHRERIEHCELLQGDPGSERRLQDSRG